MSYPEMPTTALEAKFFFCEVCGKSLLSKRDVTLCEICGSQYRYNNGRMRLIRQGFIPTTSRFGLEQELELIEEQVGIREIVPAATRNVYRVTGGSPLTGEITEIALHFPLNCNALVEIMSGVRQVQVAPAVGTIALDNATKGFSVRKEVVYGERLWADINNGDAGFAHTPSIIFTIRGYRKIWQR